MINTYKIASDLMGSFLRPNRHFLILLLLRIHILALVHIL